MNSIIQSLTVAGVMSLLVTNGFSQLKNGKTIVVEISGNCEMCKTTIEAAGSQKKTVQVEWDKDTQTATLTYHPEKTTSDEILKRIALAGYDNEKYLAPDDVYANLDSCCQYDRTLKPERKGEEANVNGGHNQVFHAKDTVQQNTSELQPVVNAYFGLKDALIKADDALVTTAANELRASIDAVEMNRLSVEEHTVWMDVLKVLTVQIEKIARSKNGSVQRDAFALLSESMYGVVKASGQTGPVYYQHCPMYNNGKGANWLSREEVIKNPYYGMQMLSCGSTIEVIK